MNPVSKANPGLTDLFQLLWNRSPSPLPPAISAMKTAAPTDIVEWSAVAAHSREADTHSAATPNPMLAATVQDTITVPAPNHLVPVDATQSYYTVPVQSETGFRDLGSTSEPGSKHRRPTRADIEDRLWLWWIYLIGAAAVAVALFGFYYW